MIITIDSVSEDTTYTLPTTIDNRDGLLCIGLRGFSYVVGYYNVAEEFKNDTVQFDIGDGVKQIKLDDGLYSISQYFSEIMRHGRSRTSETTSFKYEKLTHNGKLRFEVIRDRQNSFKITRENMDLLGFNAPKSITTTTVSDKPAHFIRYPNLFLHVDQIRNNENYFNNSPSDIIHKHPVTNEPFGGFVFTTFENVIYRKLNNITINQLRIYITDEHKELINFHGQPISYVFEIK
jgi:hypothetical protein